MKRSVDETKRSKTPNSSLDQIVPYSARLELRTFIGKRPVHIPQRHGRDSLLSLPLLPTPGRQLKKAVVTVGLCLILLWLSGCGESESPDPNKSSKTSFNGGGISTNGSGPQTIGNAPVLPSTGVGQTLSTQTQANSLTDLRVRTLRLDYPTVLTIEVLSAGGSEVHIANKKSQHVLQRNGDELLRGVCPSQGEIRLSVTATNGNSARNYKDPGCAVGLYKNADKLLLAGFDNECDEDPYDSTSIFGGVSDIDDVVVQFECIASSTKVVVDGMPINPDIRERNWY